MRDVQRLNQLEAASLREAVEYDNALETIHVGAERVIATRDAELKKTEAALESTTAALKELGRVNCELEERGDLLANIVKKTVGFPDDVLERMRLQQNVLEACRRLTIDPDGEGTPRGELEAVLEAEQALRDHLKTWKERSH